MNTNRSIIRLLEESVRANWDCTALTNYRGSSISYGEMALAIEKLHIFYRQAGIRPTDRVAVCSRNQSAWGVSFLSAMTWGAVVVPILHDFKPATVQNLIRHCGAKALLVSDAIRNALPIENMPELDYVITMEDFNVVWARDGRTGTVDELTASEFAALHPHGFHPSDVAYCQEDPSQTALINYTSGTMGFSRGVELPYRSISANVAFAKRVHNRMDNTSKVVSLLPTAHMYGMIFEFLYEMTIGANTFFLTRLPSPRIIAEAFGTVRPDVIVAVPLIIEKIYRQKLLPLLSTNRFKLMLNLPVMSSAVRKRICDELVGSFGGRFSEVIIGGAAFNREAEAFLRKISFPFTVGYGMAECGPIITYSPASEARLYSCGKVVEGMEIRIDSPDPTAIPGEIFVRGENLFTGYYRNPQATEEAFTPDGWFRTGDMGVMDRDGYLYLKGRCKSMILGPSGQNIYPEEIESSINNLDYVEESLVIEYDGGLRALIYPDFDQARRDNLSAVDLQARLEEEMSFVNADLPSYSQLSSVAIIDEEFEKTPKRSIKRYLYQQKQN